MLAAFALLPFVLMFLLWRRRIADWRDRFIVASVIWGGYAVAMTEVLSAFNAITAAAVCAGWIAGAIFVSIGTRYVRLPTNSSPSSEPSGTEKLVLIPQIILLAAVLAMIAWIGPPNNWDSMAYHLPRIIHWMQDKNVAFYPTGCLRQLEMAPGAEYLILHIQLLEGSDRWSNLIQWFSYVGCVIGVSRTAQLLGGGPRAQILASVFAATLPMACLQSGTTQNDMVSSFWLLCFIRFALQISRAEKTSINAGMTFALCGTSLGLALVTKSTMYLLAAPFGIGLVIFAFWRFKARGARHLALLACIALAINVPTFFRNYRFTHSLLGNGGFGTSTGQYTNLHPGIGATTSNILRNLGLEFAAGPAPIAKSVEDAVRLAHHWTGLDPDNPDTTFRGSAYDLSRVLWYSEDYAPNPFHVSLILAALLTLLFVWRKDNRPAQLYGAAIVAAFVLFCGYLRMQVWHCRLHLPLLVASGALVGVVMERLWKPGLSICLCGLLPLLVVPWIFMDYLHPLMGPNSIFDLPRENRYFLERTYVTEYRALVDFAAAHHARQVGLIGDGNCWEYPLQVMLRDRIPGVRVETYPSNLSEFTSAMHTRNKGFDKNLKPYVVVKLVGEQVQAVDAVDK